MDTLRTGDRALIRELNTSIVLDCVRRQGPIARTEIASMTGMGRSTVSGIVGRLLEKGLLETVGAGDSTGGRKPEMLSFNPRRYYSMGIHVAKGEATGCLTDLDGRILFRVSQRLRDKPTEWAFLSATVRSLFDRLLEEAEIAARDRLLGVGIAVSSSAVRDDAASGASHDLFGAASKELEADLGVPVWIEDAEHVGALGEKWADRGDSDDFLFVSVGAKIGASLVVDRKLLGSERTGVGQIGHMRLLEDGPECRCGLRGCVETLAGDAALIRYYRDGLTDEGGAASDASIRDIAAAAHRGEPHAVRAIERAAGVLGTAIANAVKLIGIDQVVVAGETAVLGGALYLDAVSRQTKAELPAGVRDRTVVRQSKLGSEVWLAGAAALVIEEVFRPPIYSGASPVVARVVAN